MEQHVYYRVLIVDDEPLFRLALRTLLKESGQPFEIVAEASDGEEALQMKEKLAPLDLVIVDMKMPRLNGVELIRKWKERTSESETMPIVIALSSYQDYVFVREAFLLGALDYIVKVDMDEQHVVPMLQKAAAQLEQRKRKPADWAGETAKKEQFLKALLSQPGAESGVALDPGEPFADLMRTNDRLVAVISFDRQDANSASDAGEDTLRSVLEQALQSKGMQAEIARLGSEHVLLMHRTETRSFLYLRNQLSELFTVVQRRLMQYANKSVTVGVSGSGFRPWRELYLEAVTAAQLRFFCGGGKLFYPDSRTSWEYTQAHKLMPEAVFAEHMSVTLESLHEPDPEMWKRKFSEWSGLGLPALDEQKARGMFADSLWKLGALLLSRNCKWEQLAGPYNQPFVYLDNCATLEQLWQHFRQLLEAAHMKIHETPMSSGGVLRQAKTYIDRHYQDGITLTLVSEWVGVSESHLSKLFVKESGEKFIDYMTRLRIRKAIELMKTDKKLYEISESVGYPNPEHFSRVFKKETGLSPAQYREKLEQQKSSNK
ncbi:response regulator transcription factor [Paenibacillus thalictri]|uniref:Response regulator n=1 Tax=Paenibacillus thalictri TaxID=2527873 RepID=A0A4Q9DHU5_9BACL|nr:helix-turn-helix domain-containing protein [Paenibacillus thalictri]TBL72483.1 response regulator [Paenibacillus thalictri]